MAILYVSTPGAEIQKQDARIRVSFRGQLLKAIPLLEVERVALMAPVHLSASASRALLEAQIPVVYCSQGGKYYGSLVSGGHDADIWLAQTARWQDQSFRLHCARAVASAKIKHQRSFLRRHGREYQNQLILNNCEQFSDLLLALKQKKTTEKIMSIEGQASALYFQAFGHMFRYSEVQFNGRNRQPPRDPINALLSLGYMLLLGEISSSLMFRGLHTGLGFLHVIQGKRPSLALDLLEIYRQPIIDRLVVSLFNRRIFTSKDFTVTEEKGARLIADALKRYLTYYEKNMTASFSHPKKAVAVTFRHLIMEEILELRNSLVDSSSWNPVTFEL